MYYNTGPSYLSSFVPPSISEISSYNLRNVNTLQTIETWLSEQYDSFLYG